MSLFYLKYKILDSHRSDCMTLFGGMTEEDDKKDVGTSIQIVGRWSTVGESAGYCICKAESVNDLNAWLLNWSTMATIEVFPVVDDNQARTIVLGKLPIYEVDYSNAGASPLEGQDLFFIHYSFFDDKKTEGMQRFAEMSEEEDVADAGKNTCFGRWHNLGTGTGVVVCSSPSAMEVNKWAYNWNSFCTCVIRPVVKDDVLRRNITSKPDFAQKRASLLSKTDDKKKGWFS